MACLIVPAAEAVITAVAAKAVKAKENKEGTAEVTGKISFSRKLKWLSNMLWGGTALLALEHVWHGEISPVFPFLTAMETAEGTAAMLRELATAGVAMSLIVTAVWVGMVAVTAAMEKKAAKAQPAEN